MKLPETRLLLITCDNFAKLLYHVISLSFVALKAKGYGKLSNLFSDPISYYQYEADIKIRESIQKVSEREINNPLFAKNLYKTHAFNMSQVGRTEIEHVKGQPIEEREAGGVKAYFLTYIIDFNGKVELFIFQPRTWDPINQPMEIKGNQVALTYELPADKNMERARLQVRQDLKKIKNNINNLKDDMQAYNDDIKKLIDEEIPKQLSKMRYL
jgi:hypothetical protein